MRYPRGQSTVVVPVPAADPVVGSWRERFDASARDGMPAHITILAPLPQRAATHFGGASPSSRGSSPASRPSRVVFCRCARFPGVLYLAPEPAGELHGMTRSLTQRWSEAPPYGGVHDDVVPHLTVALADEELLDGIELSVRRSLPLTTPLNSAALYVTDETRWQPVARFPFQNLNSDA